MVPFRITSMHNNSWNHLTVCKGLVWLGLVLWHINLCRLFNAKYSLYIYIKYIGFGLVWFYVISTIVSYLMPAPFLNITSSRHIGYPWPSFVTPLYRPLLPVGPQGYIPYRHRATVCRFEVVVLPLLVHVKGSTGIIHSRARPYFSSSVLHAWFV